MVVYIVNSNVYRAKVRKKKPKKVLVINYKYEMKLHSRSQGGEEGTTPSIEQEEEHEQLQLQRVKSKNNLWETFVENQQFFGFLFIL